MKNKKSFTLLEILVVTTIIALMGTVGVNSYSTTSRNARDTKRKADLENVKVAIVTYHQVEKVYPSANAAGWINPLIVGTKKYLESVPSDPMSGYVYKYILTTDSFKLCARLENSTTSGISGTNCGSSNQCNYCTTTTGEIYP